MSSPLTSLKRLVTRLSDSLTPSAKHISPPKRRVRLAVETLETRDMMSASVLGSALSSGHALIYGGITQAATVSMPQSIPMDHFRRRIIFNRLTFSTQPPSSVVTGQSFGATVHVDQLGKSVSGVTVTIGARSVKTDTQGYAVFSNLSESTAGTFTLKASVAGGPSVTSNPITVTWPTYNWTLKVNFVWVNTDNVPSGWPLAYPVTISGSTPAPNIQSATSLVLQKYVSQLYTKALNYLNSPSFPTGGVSGAIYVHDQFTLTIGNTVTWYTFPDQEGHGTLGEPKAPIG